MDPWRFVDTNTTSISRSKSDKTFFSPSSTPRVLNFPISIGDSDKHNIMVKISSTSTENTSAVFAPICSISWNTNWSWSNCCLKSWASLSSLNWSNLEWSTFCFACSCFSSVWISWLCCNTIVFNISKTLIIETSIATLISILPWAVNKLLFR